MTKSLFVIAGGAGLLAAGCCCSTGGITTEEADSLPEVDVEDARVVSPEGPVSLSPAAADGPVITADDVLGPTGVNTVGEELTLRGPVLGKKYVDLEGEHTGIVVELQPGGDFIDVLIGTTRHNEDHGIDVGIADRIVVTGHVVELADGSRMLLARELNWRDETYQLRDENGKPLWED